MGCGCGGSGAQDQSGSMTEVQHPGVGLGDIYWTGPKKAEPVQEPAKVEVPAGE